MAVYSVNRRRAIVLLILSSVLLLTLDLRGNPMIDRARTAFSNILTPFETAGRVIANPIRNAWHGATDYDRLQRENERLRDQIAQQRGDDLAARAVVGDYQELLTQQGLTANYKTVTARVVGGPPGNFQQTVEIDRGGNDAIRVGMAVVNQGGLVGKVTKVYDDRSVVLLVTDADYAIECKVAGVEPLTGGNGTTGSGDTTTDGTSVGGDESTTTAETTPSGENVADLSTTTTEAPTTTTTSTVPATNVDGSVLPTTTSTTIFDPASTTSTTTTTTIPPTTTTTIPLLVTRETGGCAGRGSGRLPAMQYVTENPSFGEIGVGDVITTTGGSTSLAPPDIVIGEVVNKVGRAGSAGPILEIGLGADLEHLNFVQIVLYVPPSEVPG